MPFGVLTRTEERYTVPAGGRSRNNERDVHVDVPDNDEVGCGPVPNPIRELKDLARV
jgi:hypothetical protein